MIRKKILFNTNKSKSRKKKEKKYKDKLSQQQQQKSTTMKKKKKKNFLKIPILRIRVFFNSVTFLPVFPSSKSQG